jgi:hypothetical protein
MGKVTHVYVKDPDSAWVPAVLDKTEGDKAYVTLPSYPSEQSMTSDNGRAAKGKPAEAVVNLKEYHHKVLPLANVDANGNLLEFADMVQLPYLHEVSATGRANSFSLVLIGYHCVYQRSLFLSVVVDLLL